MSSGGAFVYKGAGRNQKPNADPCVLACRNIACQIQQCLAKNNHMQSRCANMSKSWDDCCDKVKKLEEAKHNK